MKKELKQVLYFVGLGFGTIVGILILLLDMNKIISVLSLSIMGIVWTLCGISEYFRLR